MQLTTILKLLFSGIPAKDHTVSIDGVRKGRVTRASAKLDGTDIVFEYAFDADGAKRTVDARVPLGQPGTPGGNDQIRVDGQPVEGDDVVLSATAVISGPVVRIEFKWHEEGRFRRIRIDARKKWGAIR